MKLSINTVGLLSLLFLVGDAKQTGGHGNHGRNLNMDWLVVDCEVYCGDPRDPIVTKDDCGDERSNCVLGCDEASDTDEISDATFNFCQKECKDFHTSCMSDVTDAAACDEACGVAQCAATCLDSAESPEAFVSCNTECQGKRKPAATLEICDYDCQTEKCNAQCSELTEYEELSLCYETCLPEICDYECQTDKCNAQCSEMTEYEEHPLCYYTCIAAFPDFCDYECQTQKCVLQCSEETEDLEFSACYDTCLPEICDDACQGWKCVDECRSIYYTDSEFDSCVTENCGIF